MDLGFLPSEVSVDLVHAAGAMTLFVANDTNIIQLLGWWYSDKIFWCLHLTAESITKNFASHMLHADYCLVPSQLVPQQ